MRALLCTTVASLVAIATLTQALETTTEKQTVNPNPVNPAAKVRSVVREQEHALTTGPKGMEFQHFLKYNRLPSGQPLSYSVQPTNYFKKVPASEKQKKYTHSFNVPYCHNASANSTQMDAYMFQTEELISTLGLEIYDAAMWTIAMGVLGDTEIGHNYTKVYLEGDADDQFPNIRGDAPCKGVMAWDQCSDPNQAGVCGMCYGLTAVTLPKKSAYFFRLISSYWSIEGTVDQRCPQLKLPWTWNDYRPVLGDNAWAVYTGPAHNAFQRAKGIAANVPDTASVFNLGIPFLDALEVMLVGTSGGIFFEPWNTWDGFSREAMDVAESFSIENQGSTLGGLRGMYWLIKNNPNSAHTAHLPRIETLMAGLQKVLLASWNNNGTDSYFQQGGTYNHTTGKMSWYQGTSPGFAVDCQTWVASVLGVKVVDTAFGPLASYNLWQTVKKLAGYYQGGYLYGVGYTFNSYGGPVFSGEWTYGAINWLRVMINQSDYNSTIIGNLQTDINNMEYGIESVLIASQYVDNSTKKYASVNYANKRYYIPFGWWANHLPALCSTSWAVVVANNYNPFNVKNGGYEHLGNFDENLLCTVSGKRGTGQGLIVDYNPETKKSLDSIREKRAAEWKKQ